MIALKEYSKKFKSIYFEQIFSKIRQRFSAIKYKELVECLPEMILENGDLNEAFFRQLLTEKLPGSSEHVRNMFNRAIISGCDMDFLYANERSHDRRRDIRKEVFESYPIYWTNTLEEQEPWKTTKTWNEYRNRIKKSDAVINSLLKTLFQYSDLDREMKAKIFIEQGITVCPYCNRQYIGTITNGRENEKQPTGDIDHFFSQSDFPLFAESLYNFVPSCKVCNSLFKHTKNSLILYPYDETNVDAFLFEPYKQGSKIRLNDLFGWDPPFKKDDSISVHVSVNYRLPVSVQEKAKREMRLFKYNEVYQLHNEYIRNLIYKRNILDKTILPEIVEIINNKHIHRNMLYVSEKEVRWLLYNIDCENPDYRKVPLSKLTIDILRYFS